MTSLLTGPSNSNTNKQTVLRKNIYCGFSLELSRWGNSNEYPQHDFMETYRKLSINYHQIPTLSVLLLEAMLTFSQLFTPPTSLIWLDVSQHFKFKSNSLDDIVWANNIWANKMACVPSEDSYQPGHPPSLIRVFAVHSEPKLSSCGQRRLWSVWAEDSDQAGRMPRLIWVFAGPTCHFVGFVMRQLIYQIL